MEHRIVLQPLTRIDIPLLNGLTQSLLRIFHRPVESKLQVSPLDHAYAPQRKQYLAPLILSRLRNLCPKPGNRYLTIVDVDLYSPGLNYIFGVAEPRLGMAIISLYRLKPERYGLPHNERLLLERTLKEAIHELGHTFYLSHCPDPRCVMHFSNNLVDTDKKDTCFCPCCRQRLMDMESE